MINTGGSLTFISTKSCGESVKADLPAQGAASVLFLMQQLLFTANDQQQQAEGQQ